MSSQYIVITGGPGAGKTMLIDSLRRAGHACVDEAGRQIIQDQLSIGGLALHTGDSRLFAEVMLSWEIRSYRQASRHPGPVFFDRGIPDLVGLLPPTRPARSRARDSRSTAVPLPPACVHRPALAADLHHRQRTTPRLRRSRAYPRRDGRRLYPTRLRAQHPAPQRRRLARQVHPATHSKHRSRISWITPPELPRVTRRPLGSGPCDSPSARGRTSGCGRPRRPPGRSGTGLPRAWL
ncbi:AAA domain-containing protein [Micromonospora zamorensis]|nr:AAA domain-containing protein [Micromonospora zamorensis]